MKTILFFISISALSIINSLEWNYNFDKAKLNAEKSDKHILVVFSGSDWCKPCIQLHEKLFASEAFSKYANESLILVKADFPYKKKNRLPKGQTLHNEKLASIYNPEGEFPKAVFTNSDGKVLGTFGYDQTKKPEEYIKEFKKLLK